MNDKLRRNIWLALAIISIGIIVERLFKIMSGDAEWWTLASAIIITFFCTRFYICYRNKVKGENI